MKPVFIILLGFFLLVPFSVFAAQCSKDGYTVVYVNGILTNYDDASLDRKKLQGEFEKRFGQTTTTFITGYNESHLEGAGDVIQSAVQILGRSVSELDKNTILMQIQPQVTTQKILLLGHSQGTFYTNAMYKYLTDNGVPAESIAVYNLATPAERVEGGGAYLTSANDRFINAIRRIMIMSDKQPLPANISIPIPENESKDAFGGHHFQSDYLVGATDKIVSDMEGALRGLKAREAVSSDGCFTPPPKTLVYKAEAVTFKVADSALQLAGDGVVTAGKAIVYGTVLTGKAVVYTAVVTGKAIVFAADFTARALIAAAQKAAAAASAAAALMRNIFATASSASGSVSAASQLAGATLVLTTQPKTTATVAPKPPAPAKTASIPPTEIIAKAPEPPPPAPPPVQPQTPPQTFGPALVSVAPGFGGGGAPPPPAAPSPVVDVPPPAPVIVPLSVQTPLEGALFATSSVTLSGTTTPSYSVVASYESTSVATTADADGNWSLAITLADGTTAIGIVAADSEGNTSDAVTRTVTVDTTPPGAPSPSVSECSASLSGSFCLIPTTTATLTWSPVTGTVYYAYSVNSLTFATTTETSATLSLTASASSTISVATYDALGNSATSTPLEVYVLTQPIIINEIAWSGTPVNFSDEWIELKNNSSYVLDLSHVAIVSADGLPYIQLSSAIAEGGFYLIERRAEATSATGDLVLAFDALSNIGEELSLGWVQGNATTTIDRTPAVSTCAGWCSGFESIPMTMERTVAGEDGSVAGSWQRGISTPASSATDASGNTISGTPRSENSAGGDPPLPPPFTGEM